MCTLVPQYLCNQLADRMLSLQSETGDTVGTCTGWSPMLGSCIICAGDALAVADVVLTGVYQDASGISLCFSLNPAVAQCSNIRLRPHRRADHLS